MADYPRDPHKTWLRDTGGERYNIEAFGARTVSSDNSAAIQEAIDTCADDGGGEVFVPPRAVFSIGSTLELRSNVRLVGAGWSSRLYFDWDTTAGGSVYIQNDDTTLGNSKIGIANLAIHGAGDGNPAGTSPNPASGLLLRVGSDILLEGVLFYRIPGISCAPQGVKGFTAVGCRVVEGGRDGFTVTGWGANIVEDYTLIGCTVYKVGDDCFAVHASPDDNPNTYGRPRRIKIKGCIGVGALASHADLAGRGLVLSGVEDADVDVTIYSTYASGVLIHADLVPGSSNFRCQDIRLNAIVRGAGLYGDGAQPRRGLQVTGSDHVEAKVTILEAAESGVYVSNSTDVTLDHPDIQDCGTTTSHFGIDLDGGGGAVRDIWRTLIVNPRITGCAGNGIRNWYARDTQIIAYGGWIYDNATAHATGGSSDTAAAVWAETGGSTSLRVHGLVATDTNGSGSKKQSYGLRITNAAGLNLDLKDLYLEGNVATDGLSISGTPNKWQLVGSRTGASVYYERTWGGHTIYTGTGTPESVVTASVGDWFIRRDGTAKRTLYLKESASGANTGWRQVFTFAPGRDNLYNFADDSSGGFEIGDSSATGTTPYIDFHFGITGSEDYNARIINAANGLLDVLFSGGSSRMRVVGKLTATAGLGVGNSAVATTLGTLSRKMEVFDSAGSSIGFVPIYTTIT